MSNKTNKLSFYIDMDEVTVDMLSYLCQEYNYKYNKNLKVSDIKTYSLKDYIGNEGFEIINSPGFFANLKPIDGAIETMGKLVNDNRYEVFIISSPMNSHCAYEKYQWVQKYLPFLNIRNLVLVGNKGELLSRINSKNSVLYDDCPEYIDKFGGISVVMDRAYNQNVKCDFRVSGWDEFYRIVEGLGNNYQTINC